MKAVVILSFLSLGVVTSAFSPSEYVQVHNKYRRNVSPSAANMKKLKWSWKLANIAQKWASTCPMTFNPYRSFGSSFKYVGENMFFFSSRYTPSVSDVVGRWVSESVDYNYESNSCKRSCGHYKQVVWAKTEYVGCAESPDCSGWKVIVCNYGDGFENDEWCLCCFDEFQQRLELILKERMEVNEAVTVSQSNFQTLFEDFLKICGMTTRHQPDIAVKKMKVKGKPVHSEPHILCYGFEGKVVGAAEVKKKFDMPVSKKPHQTSHDAVLSSDCLARHVGELLACVERSVTHLEMCGRFGRDILGFIVEETVVTITHLQLNELSWETIQTSTCDGPIKHVEKPILHYSRQYNFLKKSDRLELFKAILHIKLMLSVHERLTLERKTKGTTNILSKRRI